MLTDQERIDWLRLIRSENVGPITFRQLLLRLGDAATALEALPALARRGGRLRPLNICTKSAAEREIEQLDRIGARLVAFCEPDYPSALAAVDDAPPLIAVQGNRHLLQRLAVAMVGARNASANGRRLAEDFARDIAEEGYLVVSGLARGIDAAAHRGALGGGTAAVVAGGIDVVYPRGNESLQAEIREQGVIVAELPPGTQPQARHFPRRNRIISGIALGVVVVEAAPRSGSLITARLAMEQGREVFAIPGSPLDPRAQGCNQLIKQGAMLVQSPGEVIEVLRPMSRSPLGEGDGRDFAPGEAAVPDETALAQGRKTIIEMLGPSPLGVDELIRQCQLSAPIVHTVLLELELAGRIERHPGNAVALVYRSDEAGSQDES
jgi:DNA processing protein